MFDDVELEIYLNSQWQKCASIHFTDNGNGLNFQQAKLDYDFNYVNGNNHLSKDDYHAVAINHPVSFLNFGYEKLFFLDDIMPGGASRRFWVQNLDIASFEPNLQNYILLKFATISPIGNLRVHVSDKNQQNENEEIQFFSIDDVSNRETNFIEFASEKGVSIGGATGANGEAPKLLLRYGGDNRIWIDSYQTNDRKQDLYYLVKFPRGKRTPIDCDILRAEYHYYHELTALGFNTIKIQNMKLIENQNGVPSLWLPRFDVNLDDRNNIVRFSVQSVYAMLKQGAGSALSHELTITKLISLIEESNMVKKGGFKFDKEAFVIEWVTRDLLNIIFGNSDNHGRNTSFILYDNKIELAPIYDFAPMKADPEVISRLTKWDKDCELGGNYYFDQIALKLKQFIPPDKLLDSLQQTSQKLLGLKERLSEHGVPKSILEMQGFQFDFIEYNLKKWKLLK